MSRDLALQAPTQRSLSQTVNYYLVLEPYASQGYIDLKSFTENSNNRRDRLVITGILIGAGATSEATTATISGHLLDDNMSDPARNFVLATNVVHPLRFGRIYDDGTTGTNIIIIGQ